MTVAAISAVAWSVTVILHEVVGHGGACLLIGGRLRAVSTTDLFCVRPADVGPLENQWVHLAGPLANFVVGVVGWLGLCRCPKLPRSWRLFLWFTLMLNGLNLGSYMLIGPLVGLGDWATVVRGLPMSPLPELATVMLGLAIVVGVLRLGVTGWQPLLRGDGAERFEQMRLFSWTPVAVAMLMNLGAAVLSPLLLRWVLPVALGGSGLFLWWLMLMPWISSEWVTASVTGMRGKPRGVPLSWPWLLCGLACLVIYIGVFGPGIGSFEGYAVPLR